jgi:hypothetical protein
MKIFNTKGELIPSPVPVEYSDSHHIDAFGRLRVSNPVNQWTSEFQYNLHPLYFDEVTATNGTVSHLPNESGASLAVTTDNGSKAIMQTFEYFRYQPGKSQVIAMTFVADSQQASTDMRIGYFDDDNGFFLELTGASTINFVRRTKTSGSVANNKVAQASWNIDKLDGSGVSGETIDFTKGQILWIDLQWLSLGRIRMGFDIGGELLYAHEFDAANVLDVPSTTTGNLPVRWEIVNTAAPAGAKTLTAICSTVFSEGGIDRELGHPFTHGNGVTTRTISTTPIPIISIRPATTFNSITNRVKIRPESIDILTDKDVFVQLIYAPSSITNVSWQSPATHSSIETDIAGTAIAGGVIVQGGYVATGGKKDVGSGIVPFISKLPIALDAASDQSRSLSVVLTRVGGTDAAAVAQINWTEVR